MFSTLVLGQQISDPSDGDFGSEIYNGVTVEDYISLEEGRNSGEYTSEILDVGDYVRWEEIQLNFLESSDDDFGIIILDVTSTENLKNYSLNVDFNNSKFGGNDITGDMKFEIGGENLPYWVDTASENLDIWIKADLSVGKNVIKMYYGTGYEPNCGDVFIVCDLNIYRKTLSTSEKEYVSYTGLNLWEDYTNQTTLEHELIKNPVQVQYKYMRDIGQSCGEEYGDCDDTTTVNTNINNRYGEIEIDIIEFIDVNLYPFGNDWRDKSVYKKNVFKTDKLETGINIEFTNTKEDGFGILTDLLVGYSSEEEPEVEKNVADTGITIQVRVCDDKDCVGDKFISVEDVSMEKLSQSRYIQYKLLFTRTDYSPTVYGVVLSYGESDVPESAQSNINEAELVIKDAKDLGLNVSEAEEFLELAKSSMKANDYNEAISHSIKAKNEADWVYQKYLQDQKLIDNQQDAKSEYEKKESKNRADDLFDLIEIAIGTANHEDVATQRALIMFSQAELAYDVEDYELAIERATEALNELGVKVDNTEPPNIIGFIAIAIGLIIVGAVVYSFVSAKIQTQE